jgi:hypothetical protein
VFITEPCGDVKICILVGDHCYHCEEDNRGDKFIVAQYILYLQIFIQYNSMRK